MVKCFWLPTNFHIPTSWDVLQLNCGKSHAVKDSQRAGATQSRCPAEEWDVVKQTNRASSSFFLSFFFSPNKSAATFGCITEDTASKVEIETSWRQKWQSSREISGNQGTVQPHTHTHTHTHTRTHTRTHARTHTHTQVSKLASQSRHCREASGQARGTKHWMWQRGDVRQQGKKN